MIVSYAVIVAVVMSGAIQRMFYFMYNYELFISCIIMTYLSIIPFQYHKRFIFVNKMEIVQ